MYLREAVRSMQAIIHWWLDNRAHPNGYLVGGGNQWNDITKLYNKYLCLGALGDRRLVDAVERYLDAHWNIGRMVGGYSYSVTDMTHSAEEASFIQPAMHFLRPGVPRHVYRDLLTASNLPKWTGVNARGHTHFRSNFFTSRHVETKGRFGRDLPACESATIPARCLWWYSGHPEIAKLLTAWSDAWLEDTMRADARKPAGRIPSAVQFATDKLFSGYTSYGLMGEQFLAAYQLTGEPKYLEPIRLQAKHGARLSDGQWPRRFSHNFLGMRTLTDDASLDDVLRKRSADQYKHVAADSFFQRGIESGEALIALRWAVDHSESDLMEMLRYVIRNNRRSFPIYTDTDPPTDRVYPWGRVTLPVVMLGGRLFDQRAADPLPTAAFAWENTDTDLVSLVFERSPSAVKFLVYNFKSRPVQAGIRSLQLPEGLYRLAEASDADGDRKPDRQPQGRQVALRRFTPVSLTVPPQKVLWIELRLLRPRPRVARPDLAVTLATLLSKGGVLTARVHNLGVAPAPKSTVRLVAGSRTLAEASVPGLAGLTSFTPQFTGVRMDLPKGTDAGRCRLVVDPTGVIDEINESNNEYPLALGVPPPVETQKPPYARKRKVIAW